ncbi:MAG: hypothetical protein FJW20_13555 [Acidimicrobiia bacterium]|nr:hypothetical protein [Acidimicrobiia bacterium]
MKPDALCMGCMEDRGELDPCPRCGWAEATRPESSLYMPARTLLGERYLVGRVLGYGGFGITYLGWDLSLARKVAIKEYMPSGVASRGSGELSVTIFHGQSAEEFQYGMDQFLEEGRTVARFQYEPGIVKVIDFVKSNGTAYLVLEHLRGHTLETGLIQRGGRIPFEEARRILIPVMDALCEVHRETFLHRDVSPDNIFLLDNGGVKLIDFGAARNALRQRSRNLSVILKEGYAPPEQYSSKGRQGPWTDVYGVAATLYRTITGVVPPASLDRREADELQPPSRLGVAIPEAAEAALMKALALDLSVRFPSVQDFLAGMEGSSGRGAAVPPPAPPDPVPPPPPPPVLPRWLQMAGLGAVSVLVLAYFMRPDPTAPAVSPTPAKQEEKQTQRQVPPKGPEQAQRREQPQRREPFREQTERLPQPQRRDEPSGNRERPNIPAQPPQQFVPQQSARPAPSYDDLIHSFRSRGGFSVQLARQAIALDPNRPEAYEALGGFDLQRGDIGSAEANFKAAIARGGNASFRVKHDHARLTFATYCAGTLTISRDRVAFAGSEDRFDVARTEVKEAKANKRFMPFGGSRSGEQHPFHLETRSRNFNLVSAGRLQEQEMQLILSLINNP